MLHLALAAALAAHAAPGSAFVIADVANVRAGPRADAEVIARLRINTEVIADDADTPGAPWRRVTLRARPDVVGYVARALLADAPLDARDAERRAATARDAGQAADHALWRARARALAEEAGEAPPDAPNGAVWFAACDGERAVLLAVDDGARLRGFAGDGPVAGIADAARTVSALPWFAGNRLLAGSPFPTPFFAPTWNDTTGPLPPPAGAAVDGMENERAPLPAERAGKLVLGPCAASQRGILTTAPWYQRPAPGVAAADAYRRAAALADHWRAIAERRGPTPDLAGAPAGAEPGTSTLRRTEVLRVFDGNAVFVSVSMFARWRGHHGDDEGLRSAFRIEDDDGRVLVPLRSWAGEGVVEVRFVRRVGGLLVLPTTANDEGAGDGFVLAAPRGARWEVLEVVTDRAGC